MAATGTPTPNIGLRRPQGTDPASVDDINYNSNLIDTKLGAVGNTSVQEQINSLNSKLTNVAVDLSGTVSTGSGISNRTCSILKTGNVIIYRVQFDASTAKANGDEIYSNIPSTYRPNYQCFGFVQSSKNTPCILSVEPNGKILCGGSGVPVGTWYTGEIIGLISR